MKRFYDAVVVGAGPAGARTARDLALRGVEVLLVEDHAEIGEPCHCSGLVTPRTLGVAGAGEDLILNAIRGATFHVRHGPELRLSSGNECAYVIDRVELDRRLVAQAVSAGAELYLSTQFVSFMLEGSTQPGRGSVSVTLAQHGRRFQVSATLLVGADGASSRVAGQLRGARAGSFIRALGGQAEYDGNDQEDHAQVFLDQEAAPGWFGWTIPLGGGTARLGTGTTNGKRPVQSLAALAKSFPESFGTARMTHRRAGLIPLWEPNRMIWDRVMLVGDAARQVKPASGGGILTSLLSAEVAAEAAGAAFRAGDLSAAGLAGYVKGWDRRVGVELRRQHDMRRALNLLDESRVERFLDALRRPGVRGSVEASGDIDMPSALVWRLLVRRPSLVLSSAVLPAFPMAWLKRRSMRVATSGRLAAFPQGRDGACRDRYSTGGLETAAMTPIAVSRGVGSSLARAGAEIETPPNDGLRIIRTHLGDATAQSGLPET